VRHEGDAPSDPIIILDDVPSDTITPDVDTPPQTPEQTEKRRRPGYGGMAARRSRRAKKGSPRHRRRSRHSSRENDSFSDDLNQNATEGPSSSERVLSTPESVMPEEHSPQLNNNMAIVNSHLPVSSPVGTIEENPQHGSPAPDTSSIYGRACPAVSADEPATPSEPPSSSFILGSPPEADTQREGFHQACPPAACTHPVSTANPTDSTLSPKDSHESQQNSLDIPDQPALAVSTRRNASHDSSIRPPSIASSQEEYTPVSNEIEELYRDGDAIPIMSGILQASVKYHEKTVNFQDGDCLAPKVLKGMGAIMKPPSDLTAYFDLVRRDKVKLEMRKEQAGLESLQAINLWKETFRYDYVVKLTEAITRAWAIDNPGPSADVSQAEAEAVRELVDVVSRGRSAENYRKHHRFWKFLHDVRVEGDPTGMEDTETRMLKDGLLHILVFRTGGFNRRFFNKTKDSLQTVRRWNQVYHPYIKEVQMRVLAERANDLSGSTDLHQKAVKKAVKCSEINWVNGTRALNGEEQQSYLANFDSISRSEELSLQTTTEVLRDGVDGQSERNNAIYICLIPFEGPPNGKRKIDGTPASRTIVAPCPVVPIQPGDFLGVMSGQLRYTSEAGRPDEATQGPDPNLWLDFSKITSKLSCMRSGIGTKANVALTWKSYKDQHGMNWRVEVVATKEIWPFHELVRPIS